VDDLAVGLIAAAVGAASGGAVSYLAAVSIGRRAEVGRRHADGRRQLKARLLPNARTSHDNELSPRAPAASSASSTTGEPDSSLST
jgi:hypothetical protein